MTPPSWPRRLRPAANYVLVGIAGAIATLGLLGLVSPIQGEVGPGVVELRAHVGFDGETGLSLPPLGQITASTHGTPLHLQVRVDEVDIEKLQAALARPRPEEALREDATADLGPLLRRFATRSLLAAVLLGGLTGLVVAQRHWSRVLAGATGGVLAASLLLAGTWYGYDVDAFSEARFTGALERAPAILEAARRQVTDLEQVRDHVSVLAGQVAGLYAAIDANPESGDTLILHVSDIHSNPLGLEVAQRLAQGFDVDAVLDTGDITSFGSPFEARIGELLAGFDRPYLLGPGNHDSAEVRAALAELPSVTVLDGDIARVGEIRILGIADPTFTADNRLSTVEANQRKLALAPNVARQVDGDRPDVLAVHDTRQAEASFGRVPLVVAGHTHRRSITRHERTVVLTVGSTGATGLGAFLVETAQPYEAQILRFEGRRLIAVDYLRVRGVRGEFSLERTLVDTGLPPIVRGDGARTDGPF